MSLPPLARLNAPPLPSALPPLALSFTPPEAAKLQAQFPLPSASVGGAATPVPLRAEVVNSAPLPTAAGGGALITLKLPNGTEVQARSPVPVAVGSVVQLPLPNNTGAPVVAPTAALPEAFIAPAVAFGPALPPQGAATTVLSPQDAVILRVLLQPPPQTTPAAAPVAAPALVGPTATLPNGVFAPPIVLQLVNLTPTPAPLQTFPANQALAGPLPLQLQTPLPSAFAEAPLFNLRLTSPTAGSLALPRNIGPTTASTPAVAVNLPSPLGLPMRTDVAVMLPSKLANMHNNVNNLPETQILAIVLPPTVAGSASAVPQAIASPAAPALLQALRLLVPANAPSGEQLARVLAPVVPNTPAAVPLVAPVNKGTPLPASVSQPVLLASGQQALLEVSETIRALVPSWVNPHTLQAEVPAGTVLRVNIPTLAGPTQILQLHSNQPQLLPQGAPNAAGAAGSAVPVQTPQAVLVAGSVVAGTITGQNAQGQPILTLAQPAAAAGQSVALTLGQGSTPQAPLTATLAATLVVGAKVQILVAENGSAQLLALELPPASARATTLATLGSNWEALQQTLNLLQGANPQLAAQARANLPALANFLPGLMRLLEGIKDRDPSKILGAESARLAQALGPDLTPDLAQLQQLLAKQAEDPSQWRGFIFPYTENPDGQPQQGSFFFRREAEDDPRSSTATRFVAELNLSQLGAVQLDGLVTYPEVWLKLRTQQPMAAGFNEGLQAIITPLLAQLQLTGGISVETVASFPLNPAAQLRSVAEDALSFGA